MKRKYTVAVLIAISVLVLNQILIQYFLYEKRYDAKTINLAGKQRMLSQQINLEFYRIQSDNQYSTHLPQLFEVWKNTHYKLLNNSKESKLSPITHPEALALMTNLSARINVLENQLNLLMSKQPVDIAKINKNQSAFLVEMHNVVMLLESSSEYKLSVIVGMEILLMLFSIAIIILEVIFIFIPNQKELVKSLNETKKSKEILEGSLIELKRKNQDLEQFAYVASHDLQEPLRTIVSFTQLLHRKHKKLFEKDGKDEMNLIIDAARRMKSLITGLLEYTKIGRDRKVESIDCNDLVLTVKKDLNMLLLEKNAILNIGKLPIVMANLTEFRQLFQNLIINAIKFQKAGVQPKIDITEEELDGNRKFSIKDNGIGISKEYQEQIFSIFKRLYTIDQYEGTGIGLAQCKKIVELHNGQIWVESKENEGSTFHFTLPTNLSLEYV